MSACDRWEKGDYFLYPTGALLLSLFLISCRVLPKLWLAACILMEKCGQWGQSENSSDFPRTQFIQCKLHFKRRCGVKELKDSWGSDAHWLRITRVNSYWDLRVYQRVDKPIHRFIWLHINHRRKTVLVSWQMRKLRFREIKDLNIHCHTSVSDGSGIRTKVNPFSQWVRPL